jgi:hypothetical protein
MGKMSIMADLPLLNSRDLSAELSSATAKKNLARSALSVQQAEEAMQDARAASARQTTALANLNQRQPVGGGRFGTLSAGRRGRVNLSAAFSGLDMANRGALRRAREGAIEAQDKETRISALMRSGLGKVRTRAEAESLLSPQGMVATLSNGRKVRRRMDDSGRVKGTFL